MNILFVCTSNSDRSPALQKYFADNYPQHNFASAGINKYFTSKKGTTYIDEAPLEACHIIVYAEQIHKNRLHEIIKQREGIVLRHPSDNVIMIHNKEEAGEKAIKTKEIVLALGNYQQGCIAEDYLMRAEQILKPYLK